MAPEAESDPGSPSFLYLKSAFLAMEPASCVISLARCAGGGSLTEEVQNFILKLLIETSVQSGILCNHMHVKNVIKNAIVAAESAYDSAVEGLYEQFAKMAFLQEDFCGKENYRMFKQISFLFPDCTDGIYSRTELLVPLQCSLNMLEGDTGCALWPSSLFLSEFILSYPKIFSNKVCFEAGSGVGLVGIALAHVGPSNVILTDGDHSSLEIMRRNMELNHLTSKVSCQYLSWESATEIELSYYGATVVLGADIMYDPKCIPHLVRVLRILLSSKKRCANKAPVRDINDHQNAEDGVDYARNFELAEEFEIPVAYLAAVIRNKETFNYFLLLAEEAHLSVADITEEKPPLNLLPYMLSYERSSVRLFRIFY
ncbi:hypothetical protein AXF42_Ash007734 [Apostasia shenzhenica]|uniref:Uncharacterized protein n=1 Tax=Apostasia shenzhenica TaxID=1088818 RepID=A0A2I0B568_9ASPA|nr:hypothetical protein AXF42_Ash007734 [Apostasia shenzhenica]